MPKSLVKTAIPSTLGMKTELKPFIKDLNELCSGKPVNCNLKSKAKKD